MSGASSVSRSPRETQDELIFLGRGMVVPKRSRPAAAGARRYRLAFWLSASPLPMSKPSSPGRSRYSRMVR